MHDWRYYTIDQARSLICEYWKDGAESCFGTPVILDDEQTKEYRWGWVFHFRPTSCEPRFRNVSSLGRIAFDKLTGRTLGCKCGVTELMLYDLAQWRDPDSQHELLDGHGREVLKSGREIEYAYPPWADADGNQPSSPQT